MDMYAYTHIYKYMQTNRTTFLEMKILLKPRIFQDCVFAKTALAVKFVKILYVPQKLKPIWYV